MLSLNRIIFKAFHGAPFPLRRTEKLVNRRIYSLINILIDDKMAEPPIPFLSLKFQHDQMREPVARAFQEVYDHNWFVLGPQLKSFEEEFAAYIGTPHCVGVGNGLDALTLALKSLKLTSSDEVIVPAHTFMATWLAVVRAGAKPIAVDSDEMTMNIKPQLIENRITPRTKVLLPVHMYGQSCDMTDIMDFSEQYKISIIEDNAQAHGARWLQKRTGSFGIVNATSFYPTKNLGALGDAGAITTFDMDLAHFIRRNRNYGFGANHQALDEGLNSRLDEIQAAILRTKLHHLDEWNTMRRHIAETYLKLLEGTGDLQLPLADKESYHVYHLFVVRTSRRDRLRAYLLNHDIETLIHYPIPPHLQPVFRACGYKNGDFPVAERIAETALSLPAWPGMTDEMIGRVCSVIKKFFEQH